MTLSLSGRFQTRLLLAVFVALPWALLGGPWFGLTRSAAVTMVLLMTGLGSLWELVYHGLQQRRWDKDWPSLLALLSGGAEYGLLVLIRMLMGQDVSAQDGWFFLATWLLLWLVQQGPLRVLAPRWRFQGGRAVQWETRRRRPQGRRSARRAAPRSEATERVPLSKAG